MSYYDLMNTYYIACGVRRTAWILIYNTVDESCSKWLFILLENMWRFLSVNSELLTKTPDHTQNR